ncbi:MAG: S41 family peptidase [Tannerellaceae bacterium]|nr:S41 family peptidase [Tannerellaceae bacterium]
MKNILFAIITNFLLFTACNQAENNHSKFNLDFELQENGKPVGWVNYGNSTDLIYLDSTIVKSGKYAAVLENEEDSKSSFKALAFNLPENYKGKQITLSGYIKTENITDGFAGLWMRIDPGIAFDNMYDHGVTGTTDWTKYEVTLSMAPSETEGIVIGGLLVGKGKMWLDNLQVTIDGKDIQNASLYTKEDFPAEKDKEFDTGSGITFPLLDEQLVTNLDVLGKVWGFLKYNHPEVGKGTYNWDYELFRMLPGYLKIRDINQRDKYLLTWVTKYGKIDTSQDTQKNSEEVFLSPDLSWIDDAGISPDLKKKIQEIYENRHQGYHFYIRMHPQIGNPEFKNEADYGTMSYPDGGFRLLSLYRYWNMIHYFFPNRYMTDKPWNEVLKEYIPLFILAENKLEYELAALQVIAEINDTHANLWEGKERINELRGNMYAPFRVQFVEDQLVVTDSYNQNLQEVSGFRRGDVITHINGQTIEFLIDSLKPYYPSSNRDVMLRDMSRDLLRSNRQTILVNYLSSGQQKETLLTLYESNMLNMSTHKRYEKCYKLLENNIGYVTLATIRSEDVEHIKEDFKDTKGIIIDIRNYPSYFVPFELGCYFVEAATPFVKFTKGNVNNPGEFTFSSALEIPKGEKTYQGKLVVIVNEETQSQAEYTAMAFRAGESTTIIGSTTAGADGNVSGIVLPGGLRTMISGIGVYYPDGTETQRIGIIPDIEVRPTIKGIKQGRDELLEKAVNLIKN